MKLIIGSDKSGFPLKEAVKAHLADKGYELIDVGMQSLEDFQPFFQVAPKAAEALEKGVTERALLFCGTGAGMAMVANKCKGAYAVVCESVYAAKMARVINNANVMTMGGWVVAPNMAIEMADAWLSASFHEGLPEDRQAFLCNAYEQVRAIEEQNMKAVSDHA